MKKGNMGMGMVAMVATMGLAACSGTISTDATATITSTVTAASDRDVNGFYYEIECDNGFSLSEYVELETETLAPWLDPAAGENHLFSDLLATIPPGHCEVSATPMQNPKKPSEDCAPVSGEFDVSPGHTTEIVLMAQCKGDPDGGGDIVVGLNDPPVITGIDLDIGKFICVGEPVQISLTAEDPNGDAIEISWQVLVWPEAPAAGTFSFSPAIGSPVDFVAHTVGSYEISVTVTDTYGATTSLSFPIHVQECDICCKTDQGFLVIPASECPDGQIALMDYCEDTCCKLETHLIVPAGECPASQVLPMDYCEEVCCQTVKEPIITWAAYCKDDLVLPMEECEICKCPEGFNLTPDGESCIRTDSVEATASQTIYHVCKALTNPNYSMLGAIYPGGTVLQAAPWGTGYNASISRLNDVGVWACDSALYDEGLTFPTQTPTHEWIGFTTCIDIAESGEYLVGTGADNRMRFSVNGNMVFEKDSSDIDNFRYWWIKPVTLSAGLNIIEIEGLNDGQAVAFGAEIAGPFLPGSLATDADMMAADYLNNIIFSTLDAIDGVFDLGQLSGYQCPDGYALNTCDQKPICTLIEYAGCL